MPESKQSPETLGTERVRELAGEVRHANQVLIQRVPIVRP